MIVLVSNMFTLCAVGQGSIWNYKDRSQLAMISPLILYPCREASQRQETKAVGTIIQLSSCPAVAVGAHRGPTELKVRTSLMTPDDSGTHRFRARKRTTPKFPSNSHPAKSFTKKLPAGRHFTNHPPDLNLDKTSPEPSAREFEVPNPRPTRIPKPSKWLTVVVPPPVADSEPVETVAGVVAVAVAVAVAE